MERNDGFIDVGPGRIWYESAGAGEAVLLLHGGPGASSDYLTPLMALAEDGYRVVRYDQLGSWHSDKPDDLSLWTPPRFVEEVEIVRRSLGLGRIHLIGQSWGSFLALDYALAHGANLASLVLYSGAASTRQCVAGMNRLRHALPAETVAMMARCEAEGTLDHHEYQRAIQTLYERHLCRVVPYPAPMALSMSRTARPVYETMWGPNEFTCTGTLMDWDVTSRLSEINVSTLILCGEHDEVTPDCSETMHAGIANSELVVFENASHSAHFEQPERFFAVLRDFLRRNETRVA